MLRGLEIRNMLIIDQLDVAFAPGLNVLTGETGAGKSILLDSLGFVLGWRGRADLVRQGHDTGEVTAWFDLAPDHPAQAILTDIGLSPSDELILRRVNSRDGRKTAWINDRRVSGDALRAVSDTLIELHGQHDDRGLLDPKGHRVLLDTFGQYGATQTAVAQAWKALAQTRRDLQSATAAHDALKAEEEFLRHSVEELNSLAPMTGEEAELDTKRRKMQGAERVRDDIMRAAQALSRDAAEGMLADAQRWLDDASTAADGALDAPIAALGRAMIELQEAADGIDRCLDSMDFDPRDLELTEERLFALRALARKHHIQADDLAELSITLNNRLQALDAGVGQIDDLQLAVKQAQADYDQAAAALTAARKSAAAKLDAAMARELAPLKMERAVFSTVLSPAPAGADGVDQVDFMVATNPGAPSGPLAKIASGGELSRFLLALKVCLSGPDSSTTMIFDEIDRGVGGATADAVGRRLSGLAKGGQVLVVTHSPQVAALGDRHFQVAKVQSDTETLSRVIVLDAGQRIDEIARMISGDSITDAARAAAQQLIDGRKTL
jgi:DNA repair protein RecN (Recombination protein N)